MINRRAALLGSGAGLLAAPAWAQQTCFDYFDRCFSMLNGPSGGGSGANGASLNLNFIDGSPIDSRITYTGGGGTFFNSAGTLTAATTNVARYDFDPVTHAPRGLLIEETRTNLLLASATLSTQSVTVTAAPMTLSFYGTGSVALSGAFVGNLAGTGAFPARVSLTFTPTAGALTCTVTGSVLNAQVETGAFPTSAILSGGTSGVRAADVVTMPIDLWFNTAAGTVLTEANLPVNLNSNFAGLWCMDNGSNANRLLNYLANGVNSITSSSSVASVSTSQTVGTMTPGTTFKVATAYSSAGIANAFNGAAAPGSATVAAPATYFIFRIAAAGANATTQPSGYIRRVRYWPRALTAGELQQVTT